MGCRLLARWLIMIASWSAICTAAGSEPLQRGPVEGPKLLCFKYSTFKLLLGEKVTDLSGSPESMSIRVERPPRMYRIGESEIFAPGRGARRLVFSHGRTSVFAVSGYERRYAVYGPASFSDGKDRLLIWLSGSALQGTSADAAIYRRFEVRDPATVKCDHVFTYSWDFGQ